MARSPRSGRIDLIVAVLLVACGGGGGNHVGDAPPTHDGASANACYLAGNTGTGSADDTDCCFGHQCKEGACCRAGGAICSGNGDCCNGRCEGGTCACMM